MAVVPRPSEFIAKPLDMAVFAAPPRMITTIFGITTVVGILGGIYPAFFLSSYRPSGILGATTSGNRGSQFIRQALVVFQFAISITLIISTTVVYLQTSMMRNMDRGYESAHRLALKGIESELVAPSAAVLRQALLNVPGVLAAGFSSQDFPMTYHNNYPFYVPSQGMETSINTDRIYVDQNFFDVYGIEPLAGRLFTKEFISDFLVVPDEKDVPLTRSVIVSKKFVEAAGFASPNAAIGEYVSLPSMGANYEPLHATIVGVVADIELRNMHEGTTEVAFFAEETPTGGRFEVLTLNIQSGDLSATLAAIDRVWQDVVPDTPISRYFVDDSFAALYNAE